MAELNVDPDPIPFCVADPNPDPYIFGPSGSGSGSFHHQAKIERKPLIRTVCDLLLTFYL
jgi:hypothetical protein